jgi:riboflavin kinase/FMN adenylyltransferase
MKVSGIVEHGNKRGKAMGFPTANISLERFENIEPGVYAGRTAVDGYEYVCAVHIHSYKPILEAHILDFEGDLYGKKISVQLENKIREGRKFDSEKELIEQIQKDIDIIKIHKTSDF